MQASTGAHHRRPDGRGRYENYRTPEQEIPETPLPYVWETCRTVGDQWSYKPGDRYKSTRHLVHLLVDIVAKGDNFLLNVGPDPDGDLPAPALERMREIGAWLRVNGEAIYGTWAIARYKEGGTCLMRKGGRIFAIYLAAEKETGPPPEVRVSVIRGASSVRMLGLESDLDFALGEQGLTIRVPEAARTRPPCEHAWTFTVGERRCRAARRATILLATLKSHSR